ncbi:MAG: hypothetical protein IJS61_02225 [Firmicutes bacterium]|nr:hypothetical protein [Bacillota bacterium]
MKKYKSIALSAMAALMLSLSVYGAEPSVAINGSNVTFSNPVIIENGSTLVPMRDIFEILGYNVLWYGDSKTAIAKKGNSTVKVVVGTKTLKVNDTTVILPVSVSMKDDTVYIPVRALAESLSGDVKWDGATRQVQINTYYTTKVINKSTQPVKVQTAEGEETKDLPVAISKDTVEMKEMVHEFKNSAGVVIGTLTVEMPYLNNSGVVAPIINKAYEQKFDKIVSNIQNSSAVKNYKAETPFTLTGKTEVGYFQNNILSTCTKIDENNITKNINTVYCMTYNTSNGKETPLDKFYTSIPQQTLRNIAYNAYKMQIKKSPNIFYSDAVQRLENNINNFEYYISDKAVVYYSGAGQISTGGTQREVSIPFSVYEGLLKGDSAYKNYVFDDDFDYDTLKDYASYVLVPYSGLLNQKTNVIVGSRVRNDYKYYTEIRLNGALGDKYVYFVSDDCKEVLTNNNRGEFVRITE